MGAQDNSINVGDRVRLVGVPEGLPEDESLPTRSTFKECVGHVFTVRRFNEVGWAELNIESVTGNVCETIWVEPEFLQVVPSDHE